MPLKLSFPQISNASGRKISENDKSSRSTVTHQEQGRNLFLKNNITIKNEENGKLMRSQSVTNGKPKTKEIQSEDLQHHQCSYGIISNGKVPLSCVKSTKRVGTSTPKTIKRRLTFNILDNHKNSSALEEISEENIRESNAKVSERMIE